MAAPIKMVAPGQSPGLAAITGAVHSGNTFSTSAHSLGKSYRSCPTGVVLSGSPSSPAFPSSSSEGAHSQSQLQLEGWDP